MRAAHRSPSRIGETRVPTAPVFDALVGRKLRVAVFPVACLATLLMSVPTSGADGCRNTATTAEDRAICIRANCTGLAGDARRGCERACRPARIRTLAYAVAGCREDPRGFITGRSELRVRRGDCPPVTVFSGTSEGYDPLPGTTCRAFGEGRDGNLSVLGGVFTRIAVSRDGTNIAFEMTDDFSLLSSRQVPREREGMYVVRADGSGLRRLGPASRDPSFRLLPNAGAPLGFIPNVRSGFRFSPNGRRVVFPDRGPGPGGEDAVQVVMLELASGRRMQLTHLPPAAPPPAVFDVFPWRFLDDDTVLFTTYANADGAHPEGGFFSVRTDGTGLQAIPSPVLTTSAALVPSFEITGGLTGGLVNLVVPGVAANPGGANGSTIFEAFIVDGQHLLQLTNFGRRDSFGQVLSVDARRAFLRASADPLGENPTENCQLFSIDTLGGHLRQITHFGQTEHSTFGCDVGVPPGCDAQLFTQDPVTRTLVFYSGCDPLGKNRNGGQIFAMRPDGSGLRQLSDSPALVIEADGTVDTELPGPFGYSGNRF